MKLSELFKISLFKYDKCENCGKKATIVETRPDGIDSYFCSEKCRIAYIEKYRKKGIVWRIWNVYKLNKDGSYGENIGV